MEKSQSRPAEKKISIVRGLKKHVFAISELTKGKNLRYRPPEEIDSQISNFLVALDENHKVVGCVGSKLYEACVEIISLQVIDGYQQRGLGRELLRRKVRELKKWRNLRIFALVTEAAAKSLFLPIGFIKVGIQLFGPKVLMDCIGCPKNRMAGDQHLCNEITVLFHQK